MKSKVPFVPLCLSILFLSVLCSLHAQDTTTSKSKDLDEVVVLGSRREGRTSTTSAAPVDILSSRELQANGFTQTIQAISNVLPSFTTNQTNVNLGTDFVRPATLRGLGQEHVLVLVNGKRLHQNTLVHLYVQTRGSVGADLNAIPTQMIERIEVLRDGASAQYGSDAIAGVINLVLKKSKALSVAVTYGQNLSWNDRGYGANEALLPGETNDAYRSGPTGYYITDWATGGTRKTIVRADGQSVSIHLGKGFSLGKEGTLYIGGQVRRQGRTNRQGVDPRMQYFGTLANGTLSTNANDVRAANGWDSREAGFDRANSWWYGQGEMTEINAALNGELPFRNKKNVLYFNGGYSYRRGLAAGYFRRPLDDETIRSKYPEGYLPQISPVVTDFWATVGHKWTLPSEWKIDMSSTLGRSAFDFRVVNSANVSLGSFSPTNPMQKTEYYSGTLALLQSTSNVDVSKSVPWGDAPLNVAFGGEVRFEQYTITPGEEASYAKGDSTIVGGPNDGKLASPGAQLINGFERAMKKSRTVAGIYVDMERDFWRDLTLGVAGRYEYYSDFGSTLNGKLSLRWQFSRLFAFRATASTGFRAPGLQQAFYSAIAPNAYRNELFQSVTFPVDDPMAVTLGAKPLKAEKSINLSAGFTLKSSKLKVTLDGYYIVLTDRVVLSEDFKGIKDKINGQDVDRLATFLRSQGVSATSGRYFTNALNTETYGLDLVVMWKALHTQNFKWDITFAFNYTRTNVTNQASIQTPEALKRYSATPLLAHINVGRFENYNPRYVANLGLEFAVKRWGFLLRNILYGPYSRPAEGGPKFDQHLSPAMTTTIEGSYRFGKQAHFLAALGSNNVFDVYPDKVLKVDSYGGIFQYGPSPLGFNGRYLYVRLSMTL